MDTARSDEKDIVFIAVTREMFDFCAHRHDLGKRQQSPQQSAAREKSRHEDDAEQSGVSESIPGHLRGGNLCLPQVCMLPTKPL
jgi:hypothetical protein